MINYATNEPVNIYKCSEALQRHRLIPLVYFTLSSGSNAGEEVLQNTPSLTVPLCGKDTAPRTEKPLRRRTGWRQLLTVTDYCHEKQTNNGFLELQN